MTRHILNKSRSRLCGKLEFDIMHYCALNPFKLTKGLRNLFRIAFDKKFFIKRDRLSNIFSKADKKLSKIFAKKKSYYYSILVLKKKIRFFFGVISDHFIQDQLFYIFKYKKKIKSLKIMDALARAFEMRIDFFILRLRYVFSLKSSRDYISKGLLLVNGIRVFDCFLKISLGDIVKPFSISSKLLFYKSLYLYYFGEYIAKSGFLRSVISYNLFKFYLYRFRKKLFIKRLKLFRFFYKKSFRRKPLGSLFWFNILNTKYLQNWTFFSSKSFALFKHSYFKFNHYVYFNSGSHAAYPLSKYNLIKGGRFSYPYSSRSFVAKLLSFFSFNNLKMKNYIYIFYYLVAGFSKLYVFLKFLFFYFKFLIIIKSFSVRKKFIFTYRSELLHNSNFVYNNLVLKLRLILIKLLSLKVIHNNFIFSKSFLNEISSKEKFNHNFFLLVLPNLILNKLEYNLNFFFDFIFKFKHILHQISLNIHISKSVYFNLFYLFNTSIRFAKRFFLSLNKFLHIKFFLLTKKLRNLSWSFFIIFLKLKIKARLKKKYRSLKLFRRRKKIRYKRISLLDFIFKKRRLIRLWSLRLIERIFNLLQFFKFAVRKKLRFYKLRKREYSFFLMGKDYKTRRKFFKKYRKFTALNYFKYTFYRFNIFIRKRFYRYNSNNRKMYKLNIDGFLKKRKKKVRKGLYGSLLRFFIFNSRSFLLKRFLISLRKKKSKKRKSFLIRNSAGFLGKNYNIKKN